MTSKRKKPQYAYLRVQADGSLRCADDFSRESIRKLKPKVGELVRCQLSKPRDYAQWLKAHKLGQLIVENLDEFTGMETHAALKKLQALSGVECDVTSIELPGMGVFQATQPRSLSFDEMDEAEFQAAYAGFCQYLINRWWSDMDQDQIEQMASLVGLAA